jgi:hypothetical protein
MSASRGIAHFNRLFGKQIEKEFVLPWTRKQVKKLLSSGSPLSEQQKNKMKVELHANPAMGHKKKGSKAMKRSGQRSVRRGNQHFESETHSYHY